MPRSISCAICGKRADFTLMFFHKGVCNECAMSRNLNATGLLVNIPKKEGTN